MLFDRITEEVRTTCLCWGVGWGSFVGSRGSGVGSQEAPRPAFLAPDSWPLTPEIQGDPAHPANAGRLCSKGSALGETLGTERRLLVPEISGRRASWDEALDLAAAKFSAAIAQHGPESVPTYVSRQFLTQDYYVANKLMKGFFGAANIDTNSRLCMASSVAGHIRAFGEDVVPGCYADIDEADLG